MFIYNKFLNKKHPTINNPLPFTVLEDVDIYSYKIDNSFDGTSIDLEYGEGELLLTLGTNSQFTPEKKSKLSQIIET